MLRGDFQEFLANKSKVNGPVGRPRRRREANIKVDIKETG
jgi:hypothetical protein